MQDTTVTDDFSTYYEWKRNIEKYQIFPNMHDENISELSARLSNCSTLPDDEEEDEDKNGSENIQKMPESQQVKLFQMWKVVEAADEELKLTKQHFSDKMVEFNERWEKIRQGKQAIENNKKKFRHFIREKQGKIEEGQERVEHETHLQWQKVKELKELKRDRKIHNAAKKALDMCSQERKVFAGFLRSVVESSPETYSNIRSLIERCEALIETRWVVINYKIMYLKNRDKLRSSLEEMELNTVAEATAISSMQEEKMIRALDYNVKLGELQKSFAGIAARVLERKTFLGNKEEQKVRKRWEKLHNNKILSDCPRLLISNLKMAILTMYEYVRRNAVVLPGDKKVEMKQSQSVDEQLEIVKNHIEDLERVNMRVRGSEMTKGYMRVLASERSDLRIDY